MQTDGVQMEGLLIIADALPTELTTFIHKFADKCVAMHIARRKNCLFHHQAETHKGI